MAGQWCEEGGGPGFTGTGSTGALNQGPLRSRGQLPPRLALHRLLMVRVMGRGPTTARARHRYLRGGHGHRPRGGGYTGKDESLPKHAALV